MEIADNTLFDRLISKPDQNTFVLRNGRVEGIRDGESLDSECYFSDSRQPDAFVDGSQIEMTDLETEGESLQAISQDRAVVMTCQNALGQETFRISDLDRILRGVLVVGYGP